MQANDEAVSSLIAFARHTSAASEALGLSIRSATRQPIKPEVDLLKMYFHAVRDQDLRDATQKLFADGHYARAVEEAYKCLNGLVKQRAGLSDDGSSLMKKAFSAGNPILKFNPLRTESHRNEQLGYMEIFAGCMTGIRNPRAHEHRLKDDPETAIELLTWANHLVVKARKAVRARRRPSLKAP